MILLPFAASEFFVTISIGRCREFRARWQWRQWKSKKSALRVYLDRFFDETRFAWIRTQSLMILQCVFVHVPLLAFLPKNLCETKNWTRNERFKPFFRKWIWGTGGTIFRSKKCSSSPFNTYKILETKFYPSQICKFLLSWITCVIFSPVYRF